MTASSRCSAANSCSPSSTPSVSPCSDAAERIPLLCKDEMLLALLPEEWPLVEVRLLVWGSV